MVFIFVHMLVFYVLPICVNAMKILRKLQYQKLSHEFGVLKDYLSSEQFNQFTNFVNIFNLFQNSDEDKEFAEKMISLNLDKCITDFPMQLKNAGNRSLHNIFNHSERILLNHDNAYRFIIGSAMELDQNLFSLLNTLDATKFKDNEILHDSFVLIEEHLGFYPKNVNHFVSLFEQKINDLEIQIKNLQAQNATLQNNYNYYYTNYNILKSEKDQQIKELEEFWSD